MEFRLIEQTKFIAIDGQPQIVHQLQMGLRQRIHGGLEKMIPVPAHMFCVVHRRIGIEHQLAIGLAVMRVKRDPNAEGHHQFIRFQVKRVIYSANQRIGQRGRIIRAFTLRQQNKFIATDTGESELALQWQQ